MSDIDSSEYSTKEWESMQKNGLFTHIRVFASDAFREAVAEFLPAEMEQRFAEAIALGLSQFAGNIAVDPNYVPEYHMMIKAMHEGFYQFVDTYEPSMDANAFEVARSVFNDRLTINLIATKCKEGEEEIRFLTAHIDMIPLELYDDSNLYEQFIYLRHVHELKLHQTH